MEKLDKLYEEVNKFMGEIKIIDGNATINKILKDLLKADEVNIEIKEKTFEDIKSYYIAKEQMRVANNDINFLKSIANQLRRQEIRITDNIKTPLFKITTGIGKNKYFITRESAEEYVDVNKNNILSPKIMEIVSNENMELEVLLDIIKRNF